MRRINLLILVAMVTALTIVAHGQGRRTGSQTKPVKGEVLVDKLPDGVEGVEIKDGMLKPKPGYKFVKKNNTVSVARIRGGDLSALRGTYSCSCSAEGGCSTFQTPSSLYCDVADENPCKGACELRTTTKDESIAIIRYVRQTRRP